MVQANYFFNSVDDKCLTVVFCSVGRYVISGTVLSQLRWPSVFILIFLDQVIQLLLDLCFIVTTSTILWRRTNGYKIKMRPVVVMWISASFVQNFSWNGPGACSWFNNRKTASNFIIVEIEICSLNLKLKYREMKSFFTVICCFLGEVIGWKHFENF